MITGVKFTDLGRGVTTREGTNRITEDENRVLLEDLVVIGYEPEICKRENRGEYSAQVQE